MNKSENESGQTLLSCNYKVWSLGTACMDKECLIRIHCRTTGCCGDVSISRNSSTLSWVAPPSLDLTGIDPDIVYCVEVYNITCGRRDLIISDCNVTETSYTSNDIVPDGYIYEYIVTPRSNVEGARNGTPSQPLRGI